MSAAGSSGNGSRGYESYIRSEAWRRCPARAAEVALSGNRCRLCGRGSPEARIEIHHRDYERFGRERPEDLCALCRECHLEVTDMLRRRRNRSRQLPVLTDTPRTLPGRVLADGRAGGGAGA